MTLIYTPLRYFTIEIEWCKDHPCQQGRGKKYDSRVHLGTKWRHGACMWRWWPWRRPFTAAPVSRAAPSKRIPFPPDLRSSTLATTRSFAAWASQELSSEGPPFVARFFPLIRSQLKLSWVTNCMTDSLSGAPLFDQVVWITCSIRILDLFLLQMTRIRNYRLLHSQPLSQSHQCDLILEVKEKGKETVMNWCVGFTPETCLIDYVVCEVGENWDWVVDSWLFTLTPTTPAALTTTSRQRSPFSIQHAVHIGGSNSPIVVARGSPRIDGH